MHTYITWLNKCDKSMEMSGNILKNYRTSILKIHLSMSTFPVKTWCFSDRASWTDYILITNFDALIIIYS